MRRWLCVVPALIAAAVLVALAGRMGPPVAQVDVFTAGVSPRIDVSAPEVLEAVSSAVARLGEERAAALLGAGIGSAYAAEPSGTRVLRAVEVRQVADDRIRIRVASRDVEAAHTVADAVRAGLVEAGLRERLRLASETTGGRALMAAILIAAIALLWAAGAAVSAAVQVRRMRARPPVAGALRPS